MELPLNNLVGPRSCSQFIRKEFSFRSLWLLNMIYFLLKYGVISVGVSSTKAVKEIFENPSKSLSKSVSCSRVSNSNKDESPKRGKNFIRFLVTAVSFGCINKFPFILSGILKSFPTAIERGRSSSLQPSSDQEPDKDDKTKEAISTAERNVSGLAQIKKVLSKEKLIPQRSIQVSHQFS